MAAAWRPISANVCKTGGVMTAPVRVPQECGGHSVTSPATAAIAAPVTPRVGHVPVPLACSPHTAFSPAPLDAMALPANTAASATGHPVTPRLEPASAPQRERGLAARSPVHLALLASPAPASLPATTGVSSRPPRAPAAAHLAGWAPSVLCPALRASMDPTAPRNVAVTTEASATDSLGSAVPEKPPWRQVQPRPGLAPSAQNAVVLFLCFLHACELHNLSLTVHLLDLFH